ncbi:hypothetical protein CE91St36_22060 [Christensenellaceae bacterium]|nr:hypothetical protein CE91St36_22060 [Christensenellaceae bacterium]BDF62054.1 hypothetical protein CE91St37_22040 [Christensenellaceae bacterium]
MKKTNSKNELSSKQKPLNNAKIRSYPPIAVDNFDVVKWLYTGKI